MEYVSIDSHGSLPFNETLNFNGSIARNGSLLKDVSIFLFGALKPNGSISFIGTLGHCDSIRVIVAFRNGGSLVQDVTIATYGS